MSVLHKAGRGIIGVPLQKKNNLCYLLSFMYWIYLKDSMASETVTMSTSSDQNLLNSAPRRCSLLAFPPSPMLSKPITQIQWLLCLSPLLPSGCALCSSRGQSHPAPQISSPCHHVTVLQCISSPNVNRTSVKIKNVLFSVQSGAKESVMP